MFLRNRGFEQVVAAVPALAGDPWRPLDGFTVLLYPWVEGVPAMERGLTDRQWVALGRFVAVLHGTVLPPSLAATVTRERSVPWGAGPVRALDRQLGRVVAGAGPRLALCHADLHTANLLIDADDRLFVVDWDGIQLAPAERDLLFVAAGSERTRFFDGYGPVTMDPAVVAYFRWEWVVQELADYGGRVVDGRLGEDTRRHALEELRRLFAPGDLVEAARVADRELR